MFGLLRTRAFWEKLSGIAETGPGRAVEDGREIEAVSSLFVRPWPAIVSYKDAVQGGRMSRMP